MTKRYKVSLEGEKCRSYAFSAGRSFEAGGRPQIVDESELQQYKDAGVFHIEPLERAKLDKPRVKGPTSTDVDSDDRAAAVKAKAAAKPAEVEPPVVEDTPAVPEETEESDETENSEEDEADSGAPSIDLDVSSALGDPAKTTVGGGRKTKAAGRKTTIRKTSTRR